MDKSRVQVVPILPGIRWEPNAPDAQFVATDAGFALLLLKSHFDDDPQRSVAIYWTGVWSGSFGYPNDEGLSGHPLYRFGLSDLLWAGEVVGRSNKAFRHFIVPTKESLAEVHARRVEAHYLDASLSASASLALLSSRGDLG